MSVPIVSSQLCPEVIHLLAHVPSVQYRAGCQRSFAESVITLLQSSDLSFDSSSFLERFDRDISYPLLADFVYSI